ncbi:MAG TPA: phytanoyl-CoA dioxygenase family protein [Ktedonobacteraceae bacterium]|nr:phytanoyl-CoA dioxygenase family protein [Ktedonobacteraceae bacterium]
MQNPDLSQLPDLSTPYTVTPEQTASYQQNGHILLRGVASPSEIATYYPVIYEAAQRYNTEKRALQERDTYGKAFLQIPNLWARDEAVKRFVIAHRFAQIAANLLGVERVRLYHDQALFKEASGGMTPWHQDQYYWPLNTTNTITMWMPLVDISVDMGPMNFVSGSQKKGGLGQFAISDESQAVFERLIANNHLTLTPGQDMAAGDATFHYGWTLHNAPGNTTQRMRAVMTVIYFAADAHVTEPNSDAQENDLRSWLPGCKPGDLAASPLNPIL